MKTEFRKISRVGSLTGATRWYLSEDCLLAAKRTMYAVEYKRFYLRDLEWVIVWPGRLWLLRLIIPGALLAALGALFWQWVNSIVGAVFSAMALAWVALELVLGPTAGSRICTTGASFDLVLVRRTRRARNVLDKIDAAVRAARNVVEQSPAVVTQTPAPMRSEASASASIGAATSTNAS